VDKRSASTLLQRLMPDCCGGCASLIHPTPKPQDIPDSWSFWLLSLNIRAHLQGENNSKVDRIVCLFPARLYLTRPRPQPNEQKGEYKIRPYGTNEICRGEPCVRPQTFTRSCQVSRRNCIMSKVLARLRLARSLSDLGIRREGKRDRDQNLLKFEANSGLFNENLREFWPISAFP